MFNVDARPLAAGTLKLRRIQIHAAVTALVAAGIKLSAIKSLADLVSPDAFKLILRQRYNAANGRENAFNRSLAETLAQIAREWVRVDAGVYAELKRLVGKMPMPQPGLTDKNKGFLRQFDDPVVLQRLHDLPHRLWAEVRRQPPDFRTLAKAQAALALSILCYIPLRLQNLVPLTFDVHLFVRAEANAISSLELAAPEVKNKTDMAFDIPRRTAKMLIEYRDRIAPKIIGRRPDRLFVNADGSPKSQSTVAWLIKTYARRRAGIVLTSHQFRHLSAKVLLDAQPGSFETVRQLLGHFSESGRASYFTRETHRALCSSYGVFLRFLSDKHPERLARSPSTRIDRDIAMDYVDWRRPTCGTATIATGLDRLRLAISYMCPGVDVSWLLPIAKRLAAQAAPKPARLHLVTSDQLYALEIKLMDDAEPSGSDDKGDAFLYRDGLIIALLAVAPLRRGTLAALRAGEHLLKSSDLWVLEIPAQDMKTRQSLDFLLSRPLSARIDRYLAEFRDAIPGATKHNGLWPSNKGRPMDGGAIYARVRQRTRGAFGFPVNLHRFRHAAATLWSIRDPGNVRGAKDLLGHSSFRTTENYYVMAQSRLAGRALALAIGGATDTRCSCQRFKRLRARAS